MRDRRATWRMRACCLVPPPPSHFSGVACPSAPSGVAGLPVGDTCLEPRCWLWDGSPTAEKGGLCGASHWRGHPSICPTRPSEFIPNVCISPPASFWVIPRLPRLVGSSRLRPLGSGPLSPQVCDLLSSKSVLNIDVPMLSSALGGEG